MTPENTQQLKEQGYTVLKGYTPEKWIQPICRTIDNLMVQHQKPQGVILHVLLYHSIFIDYLYDMTTGNLFRDLEKEFFGSRCILNSFSAIDNIGNPKTFASTYHRDLRFYSGEFNIMLNCLVMLDEFTKENGATLVLPGSHRQEYKPYESYFHDNAVQVTGNKGDILVFNSNLYHAGADNLSGQHRRSIPITLSRPCMKQLLDYPRAIGYDKKDMFPPDLQTLLGYNSRPPASLEQWDQPEETRYYKKDQDITI